MSKTRPIITNDNEEIELKTISSLDVRPDEFGMDKITREELIAYYRKADFTQLKNNEQAVLIANFKTPLAYRKPIDIGLKIGSNIGAFFGAILGTVFDEKKYPLFVNVGSAIGGTIGSVVTGAIISAMQGGYKGSLKGGFEGFVGSFIGAYDGAMYGAAIGYYNYHSQFDLTSTEVKNKNTDRIFHSPIAKEYYQNKIDTTFGVYCALKIYNFIIDSINETVNDTVNDIRSAYQSCNLFSAVTTKTSSSMIAENPEVKSLTI